MWQPTNILLIRGGALGDFILTMPVLAAIREKYPSARIELLANPAIASLATHLGLADNIRDLGSLPFTPLFTENGTCSEPVAKWLSGFDLIVSYAHDPEGVFQANLRRHTDARLISGPHRPSEQSTSHAAVQLLELLSCLIPSFDVGSWTLNVERSSSSSTIALHPGSGSREKNWPQAKWCDLLHHLVSTTDDNILLLGGEAERDRLPDLAQLIPQNRRQLALDLPLTELADRLKQCRVFIGHDSGPTHLAAVLGLDCIVLWGPSNEQVWRPLGANVQILRHAQNLSELPLKSVVEALNSLLTTP
jgi:heptosyltransferase-3